MVCENAKKVQLSEKDHQDLRDYLRKWVEKSEIFYGVEVPKRLQGAAWKDVLPGVEEAIPATILNTIKDGFIPDKGFGLLGGIGVGKSGAMASLFCRMVSRRAWRLAGSVQDRNVPSKPLEGMWVDWMMTFSDLQMRATEEGFASRLQDRMVGVDLLILDDLGRESLPRSAAEGATPFGHRILNNVITKRNASQKPVWWTSNVSVEDLVNLYDGSMLSRLMEDNPPMKICGEVPNRRIPTKKV